MKILLLGEYSNVHTTLAQGLRRLGHEVVLASDGDGWKDYPRDVDLRRTSFAPLASLRYVARLCSVFSRFRGYDVVQIINPEFLSLKAGRIHWFFRFLRRYNRRVVMGAFGMDYYYATACLDCRTFRYSDFNIGSEERVNEDNRQFKREWVDGRKGALCRYVANRCDAIVAGLYEYYASYKAYCHSPARLCFIPFPIVPCEGNVDFEFPASAKLKIFIGIQQQRSAYKGTDIMLRAAERIAADYPDECELLVARNVPFVRYVELLSRADVILDQLYSYTPAMNALEAMAHGMVAVGGGEPENYDLLDERELRPVVNVQPNEDSVYHSLQHLVLNRFALIPKLKRQSVDYIKKHHDYIKVARRYEALYLSLFEQGEAHS